MKTYTGTGAGIASAMVLAASAAFAVDVPQAGSHNNHAPVEVTSDTLTVFQQQNLAIFSGHVVAIQQGVRLKADKMTVHYHKTEDNGEKAKAPAPASAAPAAPQGAIEKIEAEGNVFLSTPEETASGTQGVYDVEHHDIALDGNVVLTKGKNVLNGEHLVYNFDTGKSVLTGGATAAIAGGKPGRVRALFVPAQNENANTNKGSP